MLLQQHFLVLTAFCLLFSYCKAFNFPSFDWIHKQKNIVENRKDVNFLSKQENLRGQDLEDVPFDPKDNKYDGQKIEEINFGSKKNKVKGQELVDFPFGLNREDQKSQEVEEFHFGHKPEKLKGQEIEEISFGNKPQKPKGQELEEIHFGPKTKEPKGQEMEDIHFGHKSKELKGQEVEEIHFGPKHEEPEGQELEEIHFGHKPEKLKGQEVEEINFGNKPQEFKGQEVEDIHFGHKPEEPKGQQVEEILFGQKPEEPKGQEIEEINFGHKPQELKGQEVEEVHFGPKPEEPQGQEIEEINFGHKPQELKGQEVEEVHFGPKPEEPKGQEIEEINFGHKPEKLKGQEVEDIHFGHKPQEHKGQEVEEVHFGPKPEEPQGQEIEEINFGHKPQEFKGQEVEEIQFGHKPQEHKGQEIEEINFEQKSEEPKAQDVEEINFGNKPQELKGQKVEDIYFGHKPEEPKGQQVEEINFGQKPEEAKGQEIEEINFGHKPQEHKGQEVEEVHFGPKPEEPQGQEIEEINLGNKPKEPKGQEMEDINFGHIAEEPNGQMVEEINFKPIPADAENHEGFHPGQKYENHKEHTGENFNFGFKPEDINNQITFGSIPNPTEKPFGIVVCSGKVEVPPNSVLIFKSDREAKVNCQEGYQFSDNTEVLQFHCVDGEWVPSVNVIPECHPACNPPCQNNGICFAKNQCKCLENFEGPQCQFRHKPCSNRPPVSLNSYVNCNSSDCIVNCFDGYSFPDGSLTTRLVCHQGQWILTSTDWDFLPECKPSCTPPCINGGTCLDYNKCQCPRQYVGPQCQYELAACDAKKLNFNGYYTCRGENDKVSCTLSCPEGHSTDIPLTKDYVCHYSIGKFFPEPVPKCIYGQNTEVFQFSSSSHNIFEGSGNFTSNQLPYYPPSSTGECLTWKKYHYKNFDGKVFSFDGSCSYILAEDVVGNTFRIITENFKNESNRAIKIFCKDQEYKLHYDDKSSLFMINDEIVPIPNQFNELLVEKLGDEILISLQTVDVSLSWNLESHLSVRVSENMWNKTGGLCGNFNQNPNDDFFTPDGFTAWNLEIFVQSWVDDIYKCESTPGFKNNCTDNTGLDYCHKIFTDTHFEKCYNAGILKSYEEACVWDVCKCGKTCACETISISIQNCKNYLQNQEIPDTTSQWRQIADCPFVCPPGKVYSSCGPSLKLTCGSFGIDDGLIKYSECVEGCFCPEGLFQINDTCVQKEYCPCKWRNQYYSRGERIMKDCNTCICQNGEWECTTLKCPARCSLTGNSHYVTFDGKRYDFEGRCEYFLVKSDGFSIEVENLPCEGDFANEMFHNLVSKRSYCSKIITIRYKADVIKLKRNREVLINGVEAVSFPLEVNGVTIRLAYLYLIVTLPDNVEIWWDGNTNVFTDLPGNYVQQTGGLCGTFNNNQKDDFKTPEGDIEQRATSFAEKWKTHETCEDMIEIQNPNLCDLNSNYKETAEKHCQKLLGSIFKDCHEHVEVEPFYKNCLHDVCFCQKDIKQCFCPIFADYASECARNYIELPWRNEVRECGLHCPQGQVYQPCGDSCSRSCQDISITKGHCQKKCSEGCSCPDNLVLNSAGQCIPVSSCPCLHQNFKYKPNHELIMESDNGLQYCNCQNALWSCRPATKLEIARDYENSDFKCNETLHEEYTTCKPAEPKTCKSMHERAKQSTRICFPGCVCKKGFVWDSIGKLCVNASECPCHHGGRSYSDGEKIQQDCNSCICKNGKWSCTEQECSSVCSVWGDSHFKTFDGKVYDFQGSCDFVLASGVISDYDSFFINLQIVPCGSTGISCPKSVTLKVGSSSKEEKVVFKKSNQPIVTGGLKRILIREVGLFIFAEVFDLGITVQWDKGTRVYVKADSRWKNKVKGLCGNFNNHEFDDFKTPSSGETNEISSVLFADSWRLQSYCPESNSITDTCARRPHRKAWATQKCLILKSETFEPCHSEVPLEPYLERCIVDTCGCDEGGDCECMCTAIAAYAEECTLKGVPIKWRTQQLCPLQCENDSTYSSCISPCPQKSCENQFYYSATLQTCSEESCVEGCDRPHCPPGHVLASSSSNRCIPIASCKTVCLIVNNVTYLEGDLMKSDDCHSCYCSHHMQVCLGEPCHDVTSTSPSSTPTSACPEGEIWDDCIVKCDHVCNHLTHHELQCSILDDCIPGCRGINLTCSSGMFLRDKHTCVQKKDCPCRSPSGVLLKPGDVVQESDCEKCQCVNNEFECINVCTITPQPTFNYTKKHNLVTPGWDFSQEGNVTLIIHTTVAPFVSCPSKLYESLIDKFTRFSASSHLNELSSPVFAQLSSKGSWLADANNADQYLQVDLGRIEPIFAVNVAGNSGNYVSEYHILYSLNGDKYIDIINKDGKKEIFGGPYDGYTSVKQILPTPVEARYIRFHPISWHGQISMKVDVLGCKDFATPTTPHPTTIVPDVCNRPIGIGQKYFPKLQIIASSSKPNNNPQFIGFDNEKGWAPLTNSKSEFVQLDFGDYGNFTGIITKGVSQSNELSPQSEESWVERYKVEYSRDGISWNPVLDEFGDEMIFMGNTDSDTEKKNYFKFPIHAKILKIIPVKWHKNIALRLDVLGCYESPSLEVEIVLPVTQPSECNTCPGALIDKEECKCIGDEWWNGENCVSHSECPCFQGLIAYPVGTTFTTEKCEECVCRVFGLSHCTPKQCPDCHNGLQKVLTPLCGCICKPCEENTRLCPTSNICLNESAWCNGIQDCPDDELNCTVFTTKATPTPPPCLASCPPGYDVVFRNKTAGPTEAEDMTQIHRPNSVKTKKSVKTYRKLKKIRKAQKLTLCPPYDCMPVKEEIKTECPAPECPLDYLVVYEKHIKESCPLYACEPVPEFKNCEVLSKNIKTFDEVEYKYEICDHVLTTHDSGLWNVTMVKNCSNGLTCTPKLLIYHGSHTIELYSHDRMVKVDSFSCSDDQIELLNSEIADFTLNPIGNSIIFTSNIYGFEIVYDVNGHFKIKVPTHMKGHLAGLCGLYNGHPNDDKTKPDGKLSKTTVDFGNSWFNPGGQECIETVCPTGMQNTALEICLKLKETPFNTCSEDVKLEFCIESTCDCLTGNNTQEECRCQVLSDFATKCKSSDLFGWRVEHDCPSSCPPGLVHYDCYPYACQPTCGNEECAEPATSCYSGCFCPDGFVKRGDQCIKLQECRDCVCSGLGDSTYLTFDGGITFNGNCTYIASREKNLSGVPGFEVLISNTLCNGSDFMTCTYKVEIKVPGNSIKITSLPNTEEMFTVLINDQKENLPLGEKIDKIWSKLTHNVETSSVHVELPWEHVDVRYFYKRFAFTISLPSHYYSDKVEGLCGSCSQKVIEPEEIDNPETWQTKKDQNCLIEPPNPCIPTPEQKKICLFMNDTKIFGQCLAFVDPTPFIDQCLAMICENGHICNSLEAFAQTCRDAGVCVKWRSNDFCPFTCPSDLEYQPCSSECLKTCENYNKISSSCEGSLTEGCFCPHKQILINGTCKPEKYCEYCDKEGHHHENEPWQVDKCTNCTCKNHMVICEKTECPEIDITCEADHIVVKEENEIECCPKYKCGCKHRNECAEIEMPSDLPPGMEAVINDTGCCPRVDVVCKVENCPKAQPCKENYIQKVVNTTDCCPEYFCEKPDNVCIYEYGVTEEKKRRKREQRIEVMKEIGEKWSDGPCKSCICVEKDNLAEALCTVTECQNLKDHNDFKDYQLEEVYNPGKCCPEIIRKSCKHNGHVYKVGDSWIPNEKNPCETMKCNDWGNGQIIKETRLEVCSKICELGWEYKISEGACCGHCVQIGCVLGDKIYKEGQVWFSEDKCSKSICEINQGRYVITTEMKKCPPVEDCSPDDIYREDCCLKCRIKPEDKKTCFPQPLPPESTIKLIRQKKGKHGECHNIHPVKNFTQCAGNCNSFTEFKPETWSHDSVCECCKPQEYSLLSVKLKCKDGFEFMKTITVPSKCSCLACGK